MNDSFSSFAKSIRQKKINKNELLNDIKEMSKAKNQKEQYIKNIIKIQKIVRGHLYRIKYNKSLDEINTKTVIDYLLEKKKNRIHNHSLDIISFFMMKYVHKIRKNKQNNMLLRQYKIHCINLIKARLKGILVRKHIKEKLFLIKKSRTNILKHILAFRTKLILKSNTIQNLLVDIAKIKYQLKNLNKEKDLTKIKELKNKLSKSINLFYDTYYFTKENCNWILEKKTSEKWSQKYFSIINWKPSNNEERKKRGTFSQNNEYTNYLIEFYNDTDDEVDLGSEFNHKVIASYEKTIHSSINSTRRKTNNIDEHYTDKKNEINKDISDFKFEEIKNDNYNSMIQDKKGIDSSDFKNKKYNKNAHYSCREKTDSKAKKKNFIRDNLKNDINNIDLNNIKNQKIIKNCKKSSKNLYYQREERPIKPLRKNDLFNCDNPFGLRETNFQSQNNICQPKIFRNSMQNINNYSRYQKRNTIDSLYNENNKQPNGNDDIKYEYGYHKMNSEQIKSYKNNFLNRDEKPIGGGKRIDYEAIFGGAGEVHFDGDPFGGAKQFETNKNKIHNKSNSTVIRRKPVYDARKAIEEAKLREEKEGKIEKHTEFREFLREMKKISNEEKLNKKQNNNCIDNNIKNNDSFEIRKSYSENINNIENGNGGLNNNKNLYQENNCIKENDRYLDYNKGYTYNSHKEKSMNKSSNKMLRQKLHDLEKAPAPMLNIKGVKSKIECWFDCSSNNIGNKYMEFSLKSSRSNGQNKGKKGECNEDNNLLNKKWENKIENYVDKKLAQLNIEINKINDVFNLESYYEQKDSKMKKFINIPYIKETNFYVKKYSNEIYDILIKDINKEYKKLK